MSIRSQWKLLKYNYSLTLLLCPHMAFPRCVHPEERVSSLVSNKSTILADQGPTLMISFNLKYLRRGPISKYSHTGGSTQFVLRQSCKGQGPGSSRGLAGCSTAWVAGGRCWISWLKKHIWGWQSPAGGALVPHPLGPGEGWQDTIIIFIASYASSFHLWLILLTKKWNQDGKTNLPEQRSINPVLK